MLDMSERGVYVQRGLAHDAVNAPASQPVIKGNSCWWACLKRFRDTMSATGFLNFFTDP